MSQKNRSLFVQTSLIVSVLAIGSLCWIWFGPDASGRSSANDTLKSALVADSARGQDSVQVRLRIPPLPKEYVSVTINGVEYVEGAVFVKAEDDTAILKEHDFRIQSVRRLGSAKVLCKASWPKDLDLESLPEQVLQVRYAAVPKTGKPQRRIEPPPADFPFTTINGIDYAEGHVLVESDKDTVSLREFGFRDFELYWRDSTGVYYMARWPKELPWDSLPSQLKGVHYDDTYKYLKPQLNVSAVAIVADSAAQGKMKPRRRIEPPPADFPFTTINGIDYAEGHVLVESDKDTTLLKEFGFRDFWFEGVDSVGAHYMARWPKELPWDSLPPQLKGVGYIEHFLEEQLNVSAVAIVADSASPVAPNKEKPRRRIEPPPKDYPVETIQGIDYVVGKMLLDSEKDTALLQGFGFRDLWFEGVDSVGAHYMARWPKELPWDSLPPQVKGVVYPFPEGTVKPQ